MGCCTCSMESESGILLEFEHEKNVVIISLESDEDSRAVTNLRVKHRLAHDSGKISSSRISSSS